MRLTSQKAVLKKPLQTSIAVEVDEFDDVDVEDKLHIVISVKDFRAIIQHAGITGNALSARYSLPARPIQLSYSSDAISCEFLIMTVGERGGNPNQKTKKGRKQAARNAGPGLEAVSRKTSLAPSEAPKQTQSHTAPEQPPPTASRPLVSYPTPHLGTARTSASRIGAFDLRPSQKPPPPPTLRSESLFVEDDGWEPVRDEDEDGEEDARLEWDHTAEPVGLQSLSSLRIGRADSIDCSGRAPRPGGEETACGSGGSRRRGGRVDLFGANAEAFRRPGTGAVPRLMLMVDCRTLAVFDHCARVSCFDQPLLMQTQLVAHPAPTPYI